MKKLILSTMAAILASTGAAIATENSEKIEKHQGFQETLTPRGTGRFVAQTLMVSGALKFLTRTIQGFQKTQPIGKSC